MLVNELVIKTSFSDNFVKFCCGRFDVENGSSRLHIFRFQKKIKGNMVCDVGKEDGSSEKRSRSLVADDPCSKKPGRSDLDEESIVETDEESKVHFQMPAEKGKDRMLQMMNEMIALERGLKWSVYRFMIGKDDKEKFRSLVESLKKDYNEEKNSLIQYFEGPPNFVMVAVEANTLDAKSVVGISEIVDRFYGVSDVSQTPNQAKVTVRLLFFELEVLYLLNRQKIQRLSASQHCAISIYTSGYPSCDKCQEDMIVDIEGKHQDVCTALVAMLLCVYEFFRYDKSLVQSMEMRMHNLPVSGLLHELYVYGRNTSKMMASYEDGKEMMSLDYAFLGKPMIVVHFQQEYADLLTREEGKLITSIRGPLDADFEVSLTDCESGLVRVTIVGKSTDAVANALKTFVKEVRDVGDIQALELADVVESRESYGNGGSFFVGRWLSDDEYDEDDESWC